MCTVSKIYDMFSPMPDDWFNPQRLSLFHQMVDVAKQFDIETNQPDCQDEEKAKLEERIAELEKKLFNEKK